MCNFSDPFGLCKPWPECWFDAAAAWGASRGGAVGRTAVTLAAAANAASEALGTNALGAAIGDGSLGGTALAAAGFLPIGKVARRGGDAFDAIMRHVGDDASAMLNEAGDLILQSRNGMKEVRFDFNNPAPHASPHVHVIEYKQVKNKKVETRNDRIYPNDVPHR